LKRPETAQFFVMYLAEIRHADLALRLQSRWHQPESPGSLQKEDTMKFAKLLIAAAAIAAVFSAQAESDLNVSTASGAAASAKLDFRITVPRLIYLRVGAAGPGFSDLGTVDRVDFTLTADDITSGAAIAGASGSGAYPIVARVLGNGGNVSFSATGPAAGLTGPALSTPVPWTQIVPVVAPVGGTTLPHPVVNGGTNNLPATNSIVNLTSNWTFNYSNTNPLAAGEYNGQVTYTAALP
jgi:hypothetical protein